MTDKELALYEAALAKWEDLRLIAGGIAGVQADIDKAAQDHERGTEKSDGPGPGAFGEERTSKANRPGQQIRATPA